MRFLIIRHGQSQANLDDQFAGQIDIPLTELGRKQGQITADFLKNEKIDAAYSSELSRAYDTAMFTAKYHNVPVIKDAGFNEINGGKWERMSYHSIGEYYPEDFNIWQTNIGISKCSDGESVIEVRERVYEAFKRIGEKHKNQTVVVGTHAMALRAFISKVIDLPPEDIHDKLSWVTNASVTYVDYENGKFTLVKYGEDKHLNEFKTSLKA